MSSQLHDNNRTQIDDETAPINDVALELLEALSEPLTCDQLAEQTSCAIATVYRYVRELKASGHITEVDEQYAGQGRQASVYARTVDTIQYELETERDQLVIEAVQNPEESPREFRQQVRELNGDSA